MTVCSGNTLKHAVSAPGAYNRVNALQSACPDKESLVFREGLALLPTIAHVFMKMGVSLLTA